MPGNLAKEYLLGKALATCVGTKRRKFKHIKYKCLNDERALVEPLMEKAPCRDAIIFTLMSETQNISDKQSGSA